jgi:hypothetical protein
MSRWHRLKPKRSRREDEMAQTLRQPAFHDRRLMRALETDRDSGLQPIEGIVYAVLLSVALVWLPLFIAIS